MSIPFSTQICSVGYEALESLADLAERLITIKGISKLAGVAVPIFELILLHDESPFPCFRNLIIEIEVFKDVKSSLKWIKIGNILNGGFKKGSFVNITKRIISIMTGVLAVDRYLDTIGASAFGFSTLTVIPIKKILSVARCVFSLANNIEILLENQKDFGKIEQKKEALKKNAPLNVEHLEKMKIQILSLTKVIDEIQLDEENIELINRITHLLKKVQPEEKPQEFLDLKKHCRIVKILHKCLKEDRSIWALGKSEKIQSQVNDAEALEQMNIKMFGEYKYKVYEIRSENIKDVRTRACISMTSNCIKIALSVTMIAKTAFGAGLVVEFFSFLTEDNLNETLIYASLVSGAVTLGKFLFKEYKGEQFALSPSEYMQKQKVEGG